MNVIEIFPDDTFITSYPKSGNTWVRFFVSNLLLDDDTTNFSNLDQQVPDIYKADIAFLRRMNRPRFMKSHQPYTPQHPRVLYLVRDVRAVVTSYYRQKLRMGRIPAGLPMHEFTRMFVEGSVTEFGPWDSHVLGWLVNKMNDANRDLFLLVRYEDMMHRGIEEFRKIAAFLRLPRSDKQIQDAYTRSVFNRMRQLESKAGTEWVEKRRAVDLSIPFMHSGETDSWKRDLDAASIQLLQERFGSMLSRLGYDLGSHDPSVKQSEPGTGGT